MSNALRVVDPSPSADPLATLKLQRAALARDLSEITAKAQRARTAENGERAALAAIAELGAAELATMQAWLRAGGIGRPPAPDMERRTELNRNLAQAAVVSSTMAAAAGSLDDEQREASRRLAEVDAEIEQGAFDILISRYAAEVAALVDAGREMQAKVAATYSGTEFFREAARRHQAAGRTAEAARIFAGLSRLATLERPEFSPTNGAVSEATSTWAARFAELTRAGS